MTATTCESGSCEIAPAKRIHGAPLSLRERFDLDATPPVPCAFAISHLVVYRNDYGVQFDCEVAGFSADPVSFGEYGKFIHIIRRGTDGSGCAWWMAHGENELRKDRK